MDEDGVVQLQGSYKDVEWVDLPCHSCNLVHESSSLLDNDASNHFRSKLSLDSLSGGEGTDFADAETTSWGEEREEWVTPETLKNVNAFEVAMIFTDFFKFWLRMENKMQRVVVNWLLGRTLKEVSCWIGLSPQGAHRVLNKAHKAYPPLAQVKSIIRAVEA
jgi:hypothetical protein